MDALFSKWECTQLAGQVDVFDAIAEAEAEHAEELADDTNTAEEAEEGAGDTAEEVAEELAQAEADTVVYPNGALFGVRITDQPTNDGALFGLTI